MRTARGLIWATLLSAVAVLVGLAFDLYHERSHARNDRPETLPPEAEIFFANSNLKEDTVSHEEYMKAFRRLSASHSCDALQRNGISYEAIWQFVHNEAEAAVCIYQIMLFSRKSEPPLTFFTGQGFEEIFSRPSPGGGTIFEANRISKHHSPLFYNGCIDYFVQTMFSSGISVQLKYSAGQQVVSVIVSVNYE